MSILNDNLEQDLDNVRFVILDDQNERDVYAGYLCYKVQYDLFELWNKDVLPEKTITWEEFVFLMRLCKDFRQAARIVMDKTLKEFPYCNICFHLNQVLMHSTSK